MGLRIFYATMPPSGQRPDRHQHFTVRRNRQGGRTVTLRRTGLFHFTHQEVLDLSTVAALTIVDDESIRGRFGALVYEATQRHGLIGGAAAYLREKSRENDPFSACALTYCNKKGEEISLLLWGDEDSVIKLSAAVPPSSLTKIIRPYLAPSIAPDIILRPKEIKAELLAALLDRSQ